MKTFMSTLRRESKEHLWRREELLGARGALWQLVPGFVAAPPGHQGMFLRILHNAFGKHGTG